MAWIRVKWHWTSKDKRWTRPYMYLVESRREGARVRQIVLQYLGPGVPPGYDSERVPTNAHPEWQEETMLEVDDIFGNYTRETKGIHVETNTHDPDRMFYRGPEVFLANGHKVTIYADVAFWSDASRYEEDSVNLRRHTQELCYALHRVPPGVVSKGTDEIFITVAHLERGEEEVLARYLKPTRRIVIYGCGIETTAQTMDNFLSHELGHGYFMARWSEMERRASERDTDNTLFKYHRLRVDLDRRYRNEYGLEFRGRQDYKEDYARLRAEEETAMTRVRLNGDRAIKDFYNASMREGALTSYSETYWDDEFKESSRVANYTEYLKRQKYVSENFAEAMHVWMGSSRRLSAEEGVRRFPGTFEAYQRILAPELKMQGKARYEGWNVPLDKRPPSGRTWR